jgi:hypothetical protein
MTQRVRGKQVLAGYVPTNYTPAGLGPWNVDQQLAGIDAALSPSAGAAKGAGIDTFRFDSSNTYATLYTGAAPGTGWAMRLYNTAPTRIVEMVTFCAQFGGAGNYQLGIYNAAGALVTATAATPVASTGFKVAPVTTPGLLAKGECWLAIWSDSNGSQFPQQNGRVGFGLPNGIELNNVPALPANLGPYLGNVRALRYYVAGSP